MVQTNTDGSCWLSVLIVSMSCTPELAQLVDGLTTRAARDRLVDESTKNWDRHYKDFFTNDVRDTYLADTTLHADVEARYPLDDAPAALAHHSRPGRRGKILLVS